MRTSLALPAIFLLINISCTKENIYDGESDSLEYSEKNENLPHVCTELYHEESARAFGPKNLFWNKKTLRVRFLGGSTHVQNRVQYYASQWSIHAGIQFEFVTSEPSDIRISFNQNSGSWSYIGRSSQYISNTAATMNFGWFTDRTSETEFRRTTLHEFGHALGLAHEHQHPAHTINWNTEAVYAYYGRTQDWSRSDVDNNIFQKYSLGSTNYSTYDPRSIMHYYIPASLIIGAWTPFSNTNLSGMDKEFIKKMYPTGETNGPEEELSCTCPDVSNVIACENFENHTTSTYAASSTWALWSHDASKGELQTYDWGKVLKIAYSSQKNPDVLYKVGVFNNRQITVQWKMYIGKENSAYFNIQKYEEAGREFGAQFYFLSDSTGRVEANNRQATFNYRQNTWNLMSLVFDFAQNSITFRIDGIGIASWPASWTATGSTGISQVGGLNFYAINEQARFWLDDFCISSAEVVNSFAASLNQRIPGTRVKN